MMRFDIQLARVCRLAISSHLERSVPYRRNLVEFGLIQCLTAKYKLNFSTLECGDMNDLFISSLKSPPME
jgi:hypothetical protein